MHRAAAGGHGLAVPKNLDGLWRFAPSINEEEESRQADRQQSHADHPDLILEQRSDLLGRKKHQSDAEDGGEQPAASREKQRGSSVLPFWFRFAHREFHQRPEHINEGHELQHDRQW